MGVLKRDIFIKSWYWTMYRKVSACYSISVTKSRMLMINEKNGQEEKVSESMIMKTRKELKPKYE